MTTLVKTTEEFCSRRKVRYGAGAPSSKPLTVSTATLSPHKFYYGKDVQGTPSYFIEFNIGDFNFDEISIRTEGNRLIVQGQNKLGAQSEEFSREFTRNFTIPSDVDQLTIRAQLDESTRLLTLIGQLKKQEEKLESTGTQSAYDDDDMSRKIGSVSESRNANGITYEVYLGDALKDGEAFVELSGQNSLLIRVIKNDWDKYGDFGFELKRKIKLPNDAVVQEIDHGLNKRTSTLVVKVPLK